MDPDRAAAPEQIRLRGHEGPGEAGLGRGADVLLHAGGPEDEVEILIGGRRDLGRHAGGTGAARDLRLDRADLLEVRIFDGAGGEREERAGDDDRFQASHEFILRG
ncbi:MAG TPA: hypothetical protein VNO33_11155 [Kofleriaceae bacterium]|nr:hypothetical protein [Kofleriaceae bacterium]